MGRRLIASVPGNHDLGFGSRIQPAVRKRFDAHFGPLNRIDILGNHSIVSLDTVSLSAMDQVDPKTGSQGHGDGSGIITMHGHLWRPTEDFLTNARPQRQRAIQHEYRTLKNLPSTSNKDRGLAPFVPEARDLQKAYPIEKTLDRFPTIPSSQFPTIILSHVPLFRPADTPCGPKREGNPSISLSAGYQYQNVLTPLISQDIIKHLVPEEVAMIYSGDDHDYCEIEHNEFTGRIKEITVKSLSWAMGIRQPGVQLLSLWNPVDLDQLSSNPDLAAPKDTIQNHLCLLPEQVTIFVWYVQVLVVSLFLLGVSAYHSKPPRPNPRTRNHNLSSLSTKETTILTNPRLSLHLNPISQHVHPQTVNSPPHTQATATFPPPRAPRPPINHTNTPLPHQTHSVPPHAPISSRAPPRHSIIINTTAVMTGVCPITKKDLPDGSRDGGS
jgi:ethanolamine phosphate phosphodiesterase